MIIGDFITRHKKIQQKLIQKILRNANTTKITKYVSIYFILCTIYWYMYSLNVVSMVHGKSHIHKNFHVISFCMEYIEARCNT